MSFTMPAQNTSNITEGTNLYFTNARADARIAAASTSDLSEGSNLYFTNARARSAISATGSLSYNSTTGIFSFTERTDAEVRGLVSAGGNLSYNSTTGVFSYTTPTTIASLSNHDTADLAEGTNLYFTNARARSAISATGSLSYNSTTGVFSYTTPTTIASLSNHDTADLAEGTNLYFTNARADARIAAASTSDLSEGTNLYYTDARADARVALIVDSAPGTLNTLNELAAALGDDANFSTTVTNSIATKLPSSSYTAADVLTKIKTVDGTGSGLDADTVDGVHASSFLRSDANDIATGRINFNANATNNWDTIATTGSYQGGLEVYNSGSGNDAFMAFHTGSDYALYFGLDADTNKLSVGGWSMGAVKYAIWHEGNDGSGSGLDADLLDGQQGSYYYAASNPNGYTSNVGDITGVTAGTGLTGGGTSGTPTLNVIGGSGITANANDIAVDSTVIRTTGNQSMSGTKTFTGAVSIDNGGNSSPSFILRGTAPTMSLLDDDVNADDFYIHINSNRFYILANRTNDSNSVGTGWETPHPMYLDSSNNRGYLFDYRMFADNYHPNADTLTTARTISLTGAVTGSVSFNGSSNVSIATTATADPTLTLSGDASGSATFTNLGNATLSVTIADDSHNHVISNVDGLATALDNSYITSQNAVNLAVGWYTIATNTGDRASARFGIWDINSSDHQSVTFYAAHHFGTDSSNTITVLDNSYFSGNPFRYIRIKDGGTYDGAALQIYIDDATNNVNAAILGDNFQSSGWVLKDWVADATDPGALSNYGTFAEQSKVDLNNIAQGGFATTGEIYAGGDTTQYRAFHDAYHPNADKLTTARAIAVSGAVTGTANFDGSGNISIATTATSDPTLTLTGDVTGSATFTNLGNATLTATVANDSHTHSIYLPKAGGTITGNLNVNGTTTLGNGNADQTHINDTLYLGATDSGDSHFYFGENSSNWYGDHWYWDSGYEVERYSRHAGTDSLIEKHDTRYTHKVQTNRAYERLAHSTGYQIGSYNSVAANSTKTNPIYTIGDNYRPTDAALSNMYGIGYAHANLWGTSSGRPSSWGQYVVEGGAYTQIFSGGGTWSLGQFNRNGNTVWDAGNDGSGSGLDADLLDGYNTSTSATANTVVVRQGSGHIYGNYIFGSYFNASSGNSENPTIGQVWTQSTGDNYLRKSTPAHFKSQLGLWHTGNDGSGSGLDADLLDGNQAAAFALKTGTTFTGQVNVDYGSPKFIVGSTSNLDTSDSNRPNITLNGGMYPHLTLDARVDGSGNASTNANHGPVLSFVSRLSAGGYRRWSMGTSALNSGALSFGYYDNNANPHYGMGGNAGYTTTGSKMWLATTGALSTTSQGNLWGASNDGSGSGLDADLLDGQQGSYYQAALGTSARWPIAYISGHGVQSYDKLRVWSDSNYSIGMHSGQTFGWLNDYAMTFQMNNDSDRGFVWRHSTMAASDGAMSLTTGGNLSVKTAISLGGSTSSYMYVGSWGWKHQTSSGYIDFGPANTSHAHIYTDRPNFYFNKQLLVLGNTVWNVGNDGSGSGLDADLLDGIQASSFLRSDATDTATHINSPIFSGNISTSGDGQNNYPFRLTSDYNSYMVAVAGNTWGLFWAGNPGARYGTNGNGGPGNIWSNSSNPNEFCFVGGDSTAWTVQGSSGDTWQKGTARTADQGILWGASNDGSGSGLDADLLDGQHGSYYAPASTAVTLAGTHTITGAKYFRSNRNTTSNSPPLQVYSTSNTGAIMSFHRSGYYAVNMGLDSDNVFRIGGWSAATNRFVMDMSGNLTMAGNITAYSDSRLKENVEVIENALSKVQAMRGVTFTRNDVEDKEERHAGVIAQEVEVVFPEVVSENNEGIKNVAYGNMVGLLIEAVKELKQEVEDLKTQLKEK